MYSDSLILEAKKIMRVDRQQYLESNKTSLTLTEASVRKNFKLQCSPPRDFFSSLILELCEKLE